LIDGQRQVHEGPSGSSSVVHKTETIVIVGSHVKTSSDIHGAFLTYLTGLVEGGVGSNGWGL
jgi:hypothetical protein